jgi:V8-like Glu-specific endopeptidase
MSWNANLTNLKYVLADLYFAKDDAIALAASAELSRTQIAFKDKAITNWAEILDYADKRDKVDAVIDAALRDYPDNQYLLSARAGLLQPAEDLVQNQFILKASPYIGRYEAILGKQSTLLPISWLETGMQRARAVAKVVRNDGTYGTGFLIQQNLFVTNHHVLATPEEANAAILHFNDQFDALGRGYVVDRVSLDPETFFRTSAQHDWTCVKVVGDANATWGAIDLQRVDVKKDDNANLIQHPGGMSKHLAIYHNIIVDVDKHRVHYLTDTLPGSSGSPVFDSQWQIIAIHHAGGKIEVYNRKQHVYPNEGIHIHCLLEGLGMF